MLRFHAGNLSAWVSELPGGVIFYCANVCSAWRSLCAHAVLCFRHIVSWDNPKAPLREGARKTWEESYAV